MEDKKEEAKTDEKKEENEAETNQEQPNEVDEGKIEMGEEENKGEDGDNEEDMENEENEDNEDNECFEEINRLVNNQINSANKDDQNMATEMKNIEDTETKNIEDGEIKNEELEEREKYLYLAKINEKACHYPEMLDFIDKFIALNPVLSKEERQFLNAAYKTSISPKRNSWFAVSLLEKKEDSAKVKGYHREIKEIIEKEIREICNKMDSLLDNFLIPNSQNNEYKGYYLILKGDYYRYLCEISEKEELTKNIEKASASYQKALEFLKYISILNPTKLSLALNYSVFLYEIQKKKKEGIALARNMYEEAVMRIESKKETCDIEKSIAKDSLFIIQLIKENFIFWTGEIEEEEDEK